MGEQSMAAPSLRGGHGAGRTGRGRRAARRQGGRRTAAKRRRFPERVARLDFPQTVLGYLLAFLLFAGAMQVDLARAAPSAAVGLVAGDPRRPRLDGPRRRRRLARGPRARSSPAARLGAGVRRPDQPDRSRSPCSRRCGRRPLQARCARCCRARRCSTTASASSSSSACLAVAARRGNRSARRPAVLGVPCRRAAASSLGFSLGPQRPRHADDR